MTPGRNRITTRALENIARAVSANVLGSRSGDVRARVTDRGGNLAFSVSSPAALPRLDSEFPQPLGDSLLSMTTTAREQIAELTGLTVQSVDIRVVSAVITKRRVK